MCWQDRIDNYVRETGFPRSLFVAEDGRVVGTWIMGNADQSKRCKSLGIGILRLMLKVAKVPAISPLSCVSEIDRLRTALPDLFRM